MNNNDIEGMKREINSIIGKRKDLYITFLSKLLRFRTVSASSSEEERLAAPKEFKKAFRFIRREAERLGLEFRNHRDMAAVIEWKAGANRKADDEVGIACHLDVVPAGKGWRYPAFGGTVADGFIWGRGAQDDKGPIGSIMAVFDLMREIGYEPARKIKFILGTREETDEWEDMDYLIDIGEVPDMVMVPDGIFPVINGEKGMVAMEWEGSWEKNPGSMSEPEIISLKGGLRHNMVPDRAELICRCSPEYSDKMEGMLSGIERSMKKEIDNLRMSTEKLPQTDEELSAMAFYRVSFRGRAAHGAFPGKGHNAVLDSLELIRRLAPQPPGMKRFSRILLERCGKPDGSGLGLDYHHDYLGDTTVNLGVIEMGSRKGSAKINIRFPEGLTVSDIAERFQEISRRESARDKQAFLMDSGVRGRAQDPLYISPREHGDFLDPMREAYRESTGRSRDLDSIAGTTYAKAFDTAAAFGPVDEPGGEEELAHEPNERIPVSGYLNRIRTYALALIKLTDGNL